jgi:hypothetical protein
MQSIATGLLLLMMMMIVLALSSVAMGFPGQQGAERRPEVLPGAILEEHAGDDLVHGLGHVHPVGCAHAVRQQVGVNRSCAHETTRVTNWY